MLRRLPPTFVWGAVLVGAFLLLPFATSHDVTVLVADALFLIVTGTATTVCVVTGLRRATSRLTWFAGAMAAFFWFAAQAFMVPQHLGYGYRASLDSAANLTSMLVVPSLAAGLVALANTGQPRQFRRQITLDATLAVLASTAVAYEVIVGPVRGSSGDELLVLGAIIAWQVIALVVLFTATVGIIWRAHAFAPHVATPLVGGLLALIAGTFVYAAGVIVASYHPGSVIDVPFLIGFLLLTLAARRAARVPELKPRPIEDDYLRWRTGLVIASIIAVAGLATYTAAAPEQDQLVAGAVVVARVLLAARVALGAADHLRLERRTRERNRLAAVLDLSAAIADSLDLNQVLRRLAEAAARAGGRSHGRAVLLGPEGAIEVIASIGSSAIAKPQKTDPVTARLITAGSSRGARQIDWAQDRAVPRELSRSNADAGILISAVAPLAAAGERLGYVEAWTPGEAAHFAAEDLAAVAAIGQQGGLAVRNARLHSKLEQRASTDELTGLLNRRALFTALDRELRAARETAGTVGLLLLDVDGFKGCNDTHGHVAGDRLLRELAAVLIDSIQEKDVTGRYGGDEFVVILPGADEFEADRVADRILEYARRVALVADGANLRLSISIGTAVAPDDGLTADELIAAADQSMYVAKEASRAGRWDTVEAR